MNKVLLYIFLLVVCACKSTQNLDLQISQNSEILSFGKLLEDNSEISFQIASIPILKNKVKVGFEEKLFDKTMLKKYESYVHLKGKKSILSNSKSKDLEPTYMEVILLDNVQFVEELNKLRNKPILDYLIRTKDVQFVSSISVLLSVKNRELIKNADDFYIITKNNKKNTIEAFKKGKLIGVIDLALEYKIEYKTSKICWGRGENDAAAIYDIIMNSEKCEEGTFLNANLIQPKRYDFSDF